MRTQLITTISTADLAQCLSARFLSPEHARPLEVEIGRHFNWLQLDQEHGGAEFSTHQLANEHGFALTRSLARTLLAEHFRDHGSALALYREPQWLKVSRRLAFARPGAASLSQRVGIAQNWNKVTILSAENGEPIEVGIDGDLDEWLGDFRQELFVSSGSAEEMVENLQGALLRVQMTSDGKPLAGDGSFNHRPQLRAFLHESAFINLGEQIHWLGNRNYGEEFAYRHEICEPIFKFMNAERVLSPVTAWEGRKDDTVQGYLRGMLMEAARWTKPARVRPTTETSYFLMTDGGEVEERQLSEFSLLSVKEASLRRPGVRV